MVAVVWSTVSHWVLGVPFDMIQRAKRHGGQAEIDLSDMVRINVNRQLTTASVAGVWLIGILFFVLSALAFDGTPRALTIGVLACVIIAAVLMRMLGPRRVTDVA